MKWLLAAFFLLFGSATLAGGDSRPIDEPSDQCLFVITLDGFRWQELFGGADESLINDPEFTNDTAAVKAQFWATDPARRRERLLPFFWNVIAHEGQLHGNRAIGNLVNTRNFYGISYPGYNELFTGKPDPLIATNRKVGNPNLNVLERLNADPAYRGQVAAFASWDVIPYVLNRGRCGFYLDAGPEPEKEVVSDHIRLTGQTGLQGGTAATRADALTFETAIRYLKQNHPRVVYLGFSGTDDAGHQKSYDRYLRNAHEADRMIGELWNYVQEQPAYRGRTTFLITTDHGRGAAPRSWFDHGFFVGGSTQTWMALLGSSAVPIGECASHTQLYQKQIAGSIAQLMGMRTATLAALPVTLFRRAETTDLAAR